MNRRDLVKALAVGVPAVAITGNAGLIAIAGAAVGTAIIRPPQPVAPVAPGNVLTSEWMNELVHAVNHANGFTET